LLLVFLPFPSFSLFESQEKDGKREKKKNHVQEEHTGNNCFLHFNQMNLFQTNICVCSHVLQSKIHLFMWEIFIILVSVFQLPVIHWHHRQAFTLKINPEFWLK